MSTKFRAPSSGTVKTLNVRNGDYVHQGDLVMVLGNDDLQDNYQSARENLFDLYEDLADTKSDISFYTITSPIDGVITAL